MPNVLRYAQLIVGLFALVLAQVSFAQQTDALRHTVMADGHPLAVWEKSVTNPKGHILLHHGRTWSSIPDFDLQVPEESLSLMDGFNDMGYSAWAMDARGYGGTPRDSSGWTTPDRAAKDMATVLDWLEERNGVKTNVWGWSYGSMIAQLTAQRYPEAIRSLSLFGYPTDPDVQFPDDANLSTPEERVNTAEAAASDFIVPGSISQNAIDVYVEAALAADPIRADWNQLQQWNALDGAALTMPTLLLQGPMPMRVSSLESPIQTSNGSCLPAETTRVCSRPRVLA